MTLIKNKMLWKEQSIKRNKEVRGQLPKFTIASRLRKRSSQVLEYK
jgi:hypothetical protein